MTDEWKPERAPNGLSERVLKFWRTVLGKFDLRPDEYRLLEDACRQMVIIDGLEKSLRGAEPVSKGSRGQPVVNPVLQEVRQQRVVLASLLKQLGLPSDSDATVSELPRSVQARNAAKSRWTVAHGKAG